MRLGNSTVWPTRYELLDGLRGLAALAVVLNHLDVVDSNAGHLAVMVFFVISGYCITASADSCHRNGVGFREFMMRRIRRIYPPYLLAVVFFAVTRMIKVALGGPNVLDRPLIEWVQNLTLTQWVSDLFHPVASPVQNPTLFVVAFWSLNYEEQFYLVMAMALVLMVRKHIPLIATVGIVGIVALTWNWIVPGNWICGLFIEYWAHFALGSFLFFALTQFTSNSSRIAFVIITALIGVAGLARILLAGSLDANETMRAMTELTFLSFVTLALFFLRPLSHRIGRSPLWKPLAALGAISYSLYLIHQFNLTLVGSITHYMLPKRSPPILVTLTQILLFIALATIFWWCCERPFLRRKPPRLAELGAVGVGARIA